MYYPTEHDDGSVLHNIWDNHILWIYSNRISNRRGVACERKRGINLDIKVSGLEQMKDYNLIKGDGEAGYRIVFVGEKSRFHF